MPRAEVSLAESAVLDLLELKDWYSLQGAPEAGERILRRIFVRVGSLRRHPDSGRVVPEFGQSHLRELVVSPWRIVYLREKDRVRVVRVWRSERLLRLPSLAEP